MTSLTPDAVLSAAVATLKADIACAVSDAIERFREQTGLTPSAIELEMLETYQIGQGHRQSTLGAVRISLGDL